MPEPFKSKKKKKKGFAEVFSVKQRLSQEIDLCKCFHRFGHVQRENQT